MKHWALVPRMLCSGLVCVLLCVVLAHTCGTDRRGGACWRCRRRSLALRRAASLRFKRLLRQKGALKSPWPQTHIYPEDMQTHEEGKQRAGRLSRRRKPYYEDRVKHETNQTCWCVVPTQRKEKRKKNVTCYLPEARDSAGRLDEHILREKAGL